MNTTGATAASEKPARHEAGKSSGECKQRRAKGGVEPVDNDCDGVTSDNESVQSYHDTDSEANETDSDDESSNGENMQEHDGGSDVSDYEYNGSDSEGEGEGPGLTAKSASKQHHIQTKSVKNRLESAQNSRSERRIGKNGQKI